MAAGNVAGLARRHRQRYAAQTRRHRIEAGGLGIDADDPGLARPHDPGIEVLGRNHGLVGVEIDRLDDGIAQRNGANLTFGRLRRLAVGLFHHTVGGRRRGLDRRRDGLDVFQTEMGRDPLSDGVELHPLEEGDQRVRIGLMHSKAIRAFGESGIVVERYQLHGNTCALRVVTQEIWITRNCFRKHSGAQYLRAKTIPFRCQVPNDFRIGGPFVFLILFSA